MRKNVILGRDFTVAAAQSLADLASEFTSSSHLIVGSKKINLKSVMGIVSLALKKQCSVTVTSDGRDATDALNKIVEYLQKG